VAGSAELAWGTAFVAVVGAVLSWLPWFRASLNHRMFADLVIKLLKADNADRARKLTHAAPSNPFVLGIRAALDAAKEQSEPRAMFDEVARPAMARLTAHFGFALASVAGAALCAYLVADKGAPTITLLGPAIAVALHVHAFWIAKSIADASAVEADRIFAVMAERATN
jgi:hypothetical protein